MAVVVVEGVGNSPYVVIMPRTDSLAKDKHLSRQGVSQSLGQIMGRRMGMRQRRMNNDGRPSSLKGVERSRRQ